MKLKLLTLIGLLVFAAACNDNNSDDPEPELTGMSGTVNGQAWSSVEITAYYVNNIALITAVGVNGSVITIRFVTSTTPETREYQMFYNSSSDVVTYQELGNSNAFATNQYDGSNPIPGSVKISKFDKAEKKISGTCATSVIRTADQQERTIDIAFHNVKYKTEIGSTPTKTMTCKVDGVNWSASAVNAVKSGFTNSISIVGNATNGTTVAVTIPDDAVPGTFSIGTLPGISDFLCQYNPTPSTFMTGYPGSVTITEHDDMTRVVKGTFSFTATSDSDAVEITAGNFVATY